MENKYKILELLNLIQLALRSKSLFLSIEISYKVVKIPKETERPPSLLETKDSPKYRERYILNIEGFTKGFNSLKKVEDYILKETYLENMKLKYLTYRFISKDENGRYVQKEDIAVNIIKK